jgi:hypothetical protein
VAVNYPKMASSSDLQRTVMRLSCPVHSTGEQALSTVDGKQYITVQKELKYDIIQIDLLRA